MLSLRLQLLRCFSDSSALLFLHLTIFQHFSCFPNSAILCKLFLSTLQLFFNILLLFFLNLVLDFCKRLLLQETFSFSGRHEKISHFPKRFWKFFHFNLFFFVFFLFFYLFCDKSRGSLRRYSTHEIWWTANLKRRRNLLIADAIDRGCGKFSRKYDCIFQDKKKT